MTDTTVKPPWNRCETTSLL